MPRRRSGSPLREASRTSPIRTGQASTQARSCCRRPSPASRSSTAAVSSSSVEACPRSTGTSCCTPGRQCYALASDDSHHPGFDSDLAWTWVRSSPTVAGVLEALRSGCFYSSSGPRITSVIAGNGSVEVQCDPCCSVRVVFGVSSGAAVNSGRLGYRYGGQILSTTPEGLITAARLDLPETAPYARVEVADVRGGRAWTNPL